VQTIQFNVAELECESDHVW